MGAPGQIWCKPAVRRIQGKTVCKERLSFPEGFPPEHLESRIDIVRPLGQACPVSSFWRSIPFFRALLLDLALLSNPDQGSTGAIVAAVVALRRISL